MRAYAARHHPAYWAFVVHRLSGLALALFLPVHLYVLSLSLQGAAALDAFLVWTEGPWFKAGELILVVLLTAHLAGGLRLLALEFVGWSPRHKTYIALSFGLSFGAGLAFLLGVV